jgi:PEGA domain
MKTVSKQRYPSRMFKGAVALVLLSIITCFWHFAFAAGGKKVAVLELVNKAGVTDDEAYFLTDKVRRTASQMLPISHFTIMTSENIEELLPPDMDLAKCTDAKCEVEMGRMIGAEYIVTGEILRYAGDLRVQVKVHHIPTGHFIGSADTDAGSLKEQESMLSNISSQLMGKVLGHAGVAAPARPGGGAVFAAPSQPSAPSGAAEVRALAPTEKPPATATGPAGLYITTKPTGADVYLGEVKAGTTAPAFQKMSLQAGTKVRVTLKMNLYHDLSFDVELKPGVMKFEGVELKPAFGSLKIESEPSSAQVFIGGEKVGDTPFNKSRYASGQYLVTVKKEWYLPQEDLQITVSDGQATTKMFTLSQDFGTLEIEQSSPTGIDVFLDGKKLGTTPGNWRLPPVEKGKLELHKDHFRPKEMEITIGRDQIVRVTQQQATLIERIGALQIYTSPPEKNALVYVDGKQYGEAPLVVSSLREGTHIVSVESDKLTGKETVQVTEGKTTSQQVYLSPRNVKIYQFQSSNSKDVRLITPRTDASVFDKEKVRKTVGEMEFSDSITLEISLMTYNSRPSSIYPPISLIFGAGTVLVGYLFIPAWLECYEVISKTTIASASGDKRETNMTKTSKWIATWFFYTDKALQKEENMDRFGNKEVLTKQIISIFEKHSKQ